MAFWWGGWCWIPAGVSGDCQMGGPWCATQCQEGVDGEGDGECRRQDGADGEADGECGHQGAGDRKVMVSVVARVVVAVVLIGIVIVIDDSDDDYDSGRLIEVKIVMTM